MKKILLLSAIIAPAILHAAADQTLSPFPGAHSGINIWSSKKLNIPIENKSLLPPNKQYHEETWTNESVQSLFEVSKYGKKEAAQYDKVSSQSDTHLKSDISKIKLSFQFKGIPNISKENIIGFSAAGGYSKNGWNGVVQFIQTPELGVCSFTTFAIESVILAKESIANTINGKPTENDISGNQTNGFLYHVNWYTNTRRNSFECANRKLNTEIVNSMTVIAKDIDRSISEK